MGTLSHQSSHASTWWMDLSTPADPFPVIADLLTALPLGGVEWVTVLVAALVIGAAVAVTAYATRQRTPVTDLDTHVADSGVEVQR